MKFNRGVALGTCLVLVIAACGGSSSSSRQRNSASMPCFDSADALAATVLPSYTKYNEASALLDTVTKTYNDEVAANKVLVDNPPQDLIDANKKYMDLDNGPALKAAQATYDASQLKLRAVNARLSTDASGDWDAWEREFNTVSAENTSALTALWAAKNAITAAKEALQILVASRKLALDNSTARMGAAWINFVTVRDSLIASKAAYDAYEGATICPPTLIAGDAEASGAESSSTSTTHVTYQFEEDPTTSLGDVPILSPGDPEVATNGKKSTPTTNRPVYNFEEDPIDLVQLPILLSPDPESVPMSTSSTTTEPRRVFQFEEDSSLPPLDNIEIPVLVAPSNSSSTTSTLVSTTSSTSSLPPVTIPNNINNNIQKNFYNEILICYVNDQPVPIINPITATTLGINEIANPITPIVITNNEQTIVVTVLPTPRPPVQETSTTSTVLSSPSSTTLSSATTSTVVAEQEQTGRVVYVSVVGFEDKAPVSVSVAETGTVLTTFVTNSEGQAGQEIAIPTSVKEASFHLVVAGTNDKQQSVVMPVPQKISFVQAAATETGSAVTTLAPTATSTTDSATSVSTTSQESNGTNIWGWWWVLLLLLVLIMIAYRIYEGKSKK